MITSLGSLRLREALAIVERRRRLLRTVVVAVVLVGLLLTVLAPGLLPSHPLVGAAVALVALLVGFTVTLAVDAGDDTVRGPRHVATAGGELVGVLPTAVSPRRRRTSPRRCSTRGPTSGWSSG
jgi:hypothetical protein